MGTTTSSDGRPYLRIEYVARTGDGRVIDTSDPDAATESDLAGLEASGPIVVVPGEGHLFEPLEEALSDAEPGTRIEMAVEPAETFGTVDPEAMTTVDGALFGEDTPEAGATVRFDGRRATVHEVADGIVTLDFNHPLAGITLEYEIEVLDRLDGIEARARGLATTHGLRDVAVEYAADAGTVRLRRSVGSPDSDRDARTRAYVEDVRRLLDVASVEIVERYD